MTKKIAAIVFGVLLLAGCDKHFTTHNTNDTPPAPDGCIQVYEHEWGDDQTADKYMGVYCEQ